MPGSSSRATPGPARGRPSRWTSRTTVPRSAASSRWTAAQSRTRATRWRSTSRRTPARPTSSTRSRRRSGGTSTVDLVADGQKIESVTVAYLVHDVTQLVVGVLAEEPGPIISQIKLPASTTGVMPAVVPLTVADLPSRVEGWSTIDRLIWQDIDSNGLAPEQLEALRRWIAAGGRLIILGGSAGIGTLSAFPDDILPYRPTATVEADPAVLTSVLGPAPDGAADVVAMAGALTNGRALATSGDRVIAAELGYGAGRVTILGFDTTTSWISESARRRGAVARRPARPNQRRHPARGRQPAAPGRLPAARACAAADRGPARDHRRLHPDHRPDQLPDPEADGPPRAGLGHDARARARLRHARRSGTAPS